MSRDAADPTAVTHDMRTYQREWSRNRRPKLYHLWNNMNQRCYNPKTQYYNLYGGRGIRVCKRWSIGEDGKTGYQCFVQDVGMRPTDQHSIDRINTNGNYEPGNVRWATKREQSLNRRIQSNNKTGHVGVSIDGNRYRVTYCKKYLGLFKTLESAVKARKRAEKLDYTADEDMLPWNHIDPPEINDF